MSWGQSYHNAASMKRWPVLCLLPAARHGRVRGVGASAPDRRVLTLSFVGDLMMHGANREATDYR